MVSIIEVTDKAQLRRFVDYPNELYKDVPQFVPATYGDDLSDWDRSKNPAFEYCDARCWLAMRDGEIVGCIGAIHSRKANDKWGANRLRFTQVDFIDDPEVSSALFRTVEAWAKELDCTAVHGPLGFTDMDREGMLVEGFDRRSCFFTYYNYPYYIDHMAALGYVKDVDWIEELITVPEDEATIQRWEKISDFVLKRHRLHIHEARNRLSYLPLLKPFFELVNLAYAPLYGTVDLSDRQIKKYSAKFAPLINPNTTCFVMDENDRMVGLRRRCAKPGLRPAEAPGPPHAHRLDRRSQGLPQERHRGPAAHRRPPGLPEKGCQRHYPQQGHERLPQAGHQAGRDRPHAGAERQGPVPVEGFSDRTA